MKSEIYFKKRFAAWILKFWPVQFFICKILPGIRFSVSPPEMTGAQFEAFAKNVRPGMLVFSKDRRKLASWLTPGKWDHVAVVDANLMIVEAHMPKVRQISLFDFCHTSDEVGILIPPKAVAESFISECHRFIGLPYDTFFADGREALYCSEMIWDMDIGNELGFDTVDEIGLGIGYVSPDDLWNSKNALNRASCLDLANGKAWDFDGPAKVDDLISEFTHGVEF